MLDKCDRLNDSLTLVVDPTEGARTVLCDVLRQEGFDARPFGSARACLASPLPAIPTCLVTEAELPDLPGSELAKALAQGHREIPTVFTSTKADIAQSIAAMKSGAVDFLLKPVEARALLSAVQVGLRRDAACLQARVHSETLARRYSLLTPRERQVMEAVTRGLMNKQIAWELQIAEITVKLHRSSLMKKLKLRTLPDLVRARQIIAPSPAIATCA